jgi:hypothetical protein
LLTTDFSTADCLASVLLFIFSVQFVRALLSQGLLFLVCSYCFYIHSGVKLSFLPVLYITSGVAPCCMLAEVFFWGADWLDWVISVVGQLSKVESLVG